MNVLVRSDKPSVLSLLRNLPEEKLDQPRQLAIQLQDSEGTATGQQ